MNKIKHIIISLGLVLSMGSALVFATATTPTLAQKESVCEGIGLAGGAPDTGCAQPADQPNVNSVVKNAINILGIVVGVISVIMIIIGGLKYITSGGDSSRVSSAKDTILYAVIGLVVVAMSQVIVRYVLTEALK